MSGSDKPRVVIIGAGFGGIGMAVRLLQAGHDNLVVLEKSGGVGGTWRDNTYPGAACDVPAILYSFSFHPGRWRQRYAGQADILAYLADVVRTFALEPYLRFDCEVAALDFDEQSDSWRVSLPGGETLEADVVVSSVGQLNRPVIPKLSGLESFAGEAWHSARWDSSVDLTGKRVAVVGTGASAIQFVPEVAKQAAHVTVFQRSAPYVIPKPDRAYSGRYLRLLDRVPMLQRGSRLGQYVRHESRALGFITAPRLMSVMRKQWATFLEQEIPDPELRRTLTPDYVMGCKRILISNDWYAALRRDNVAVVTSHIREITPHAVVTEDGQEHPCDAIVFGTGFRTLDFLQPMRVTGRGGQTLHDAWQEGAQAYLGTTVAGFPNLFLLYGPNTNLGHNSIIYMLESQYEYVLDTLATLQQERLAWIDVRDDAQNRWNEQLHERSSSTVFETGCDSWYTTATGRNTNNWPGYTFDFRRRTRRLDLSDYEVMPRAPQPELAPDRRTTPLVGA